MPKHLKNLTQGMYFPAVAGTGVVLVLFRVTMHDAVYLTLTDLAVFYGVVLAIFSAACYVAISLVPDEQYRLYEFGFDQIGVTALFGIYYFLGLFHTNKIQAPNFAGVYSCIIIGVLAQGLWRSRRKDRFSRTLWIARITVIIMAVVGITFLHRFLWFNVIAFLLVCALTLKYIFIIRLRVKLASQSR